jgi:ATP-binding cassette subfamily C (CFTR/MRP) protein 1
MYHKHSNLSSRLMLCSTTAQVLKDINLQILPGQNIVICGRTGSGKSTLLSTLLRILPNSIGNITIDSVSLNTVPLATLRKRLITIPQDFIHLQGSIRLNADPLTSSNDADIIDVLTTVTLWTTFESQDGLSADFKLDNLSQGQQQLFALARAIIQQRAQGTAVVLLDEAMSSVDADTERTMRDVMKKQFAGCSIVNVTHKVDTILEADLVAVLDGGELVESGVPGELIEKKMVN